MDDIIKKIESLSRGQVLVVRSLGPMSTIFPQWSKIKKISDNVYEYRQKRYVGYTHVVGIEATERKRVNGVVLGRDEEGNLVGEKFYVFLTTRQIAKTLKEQQ